MTTFTIHTVESAPAEVKEILETVEKDNNGYIPNLIGLLANAPTVLEAYQIVSSIHRRNSLTPVEREVVKSGSRDQWLCLLCRRSHSLFHKTNPDE
ncbi:macrophage infectivity potentiator protein [Streptococcus pneumoniae]|nr:macrophage infectivity potentiator protein [Streptococcus pneumoniae]